MSKTIDEKVVSMQFDNRNFESNVKTSLSTLDKLKQSLHLKGASKGLEDVGAAAKNCDLSPISKGVEAAKVKFSAMEVVAVTALANITNSAINTGKRLVSSLTIDQVTAGWSKYEQKTASVQTIMNSTGKTIDEVNGYLDELMWYSDETSYGFTDMTASLGQLTSAGGNIEKLVPMIEGVANATAFAGKGAAEFSRAIYNLNQSYSAGHLQLMDWKSLELAGVASKQLKETLIETAEAMGKIKKGEVTIANFAETLKDKWADTEVMENAFGKFSDLTQAAYKAVKAGEYDTASEAIEALAGKYDELGAKAFKSAQEAKSFSEVIDATKDAVSTGWMRTSELIFGNYEEAKTLWTDMANSFYDIFASGSESRNSILGNALNSKWDKLVEKIEETGVSVEDFQSKIKETAKEHGIAIDDLIEEYGSLGRVISAGKLSKSVIVETIKKLAGYFDKTSKAVSVTTESLEHFQGIVNKVIRGDFGFGADRVKALAEAGENYATVQGLVNKVWKRTGGTWSDCTLKAEDLTDIIDNLSDSELQSIGYTEEQVDALRELAKQAEETGTPINELIESLDKPSGRELLFDTIHNILEGLSRTLQTFKAAWSEIFTPERTSKRIYNVIKALNDFSKKLVISEETADKLKRTFKGLFAIIDIITTVTGGVLKTAFKILCHVLKLADIDVLSLTASVGDAIVKFRDWLFENNIIAKAIRKVISIVGKAITVVRNWIKAFIKLPSVQKAIDNIKTSFSSAASSIRKHLSETGKQFKDFVKRVKELDSISLENIITVVKDFCKNVLGYFFNFSGLFRKIKNALSNFKENVKKYLDSAGSKFDWLKEKIKGLVEFIKDKLPAAIAIGMGALLIKGINKIAKALSLFAEPLQGLSNILTGAGKAINNFAGWIKAKAWNEKASALVKMALAVAILAASVALLTLLDQSKLWSSIGALAVLIASLSALAFAVSLIEKFGDFGKVGTALLALSVSLLILVKCIKAMESLDGDKAWNNVLILGTMAVGLATVAGVLGKVAPKLSKGAFTLIAMALALRILVGVLKSIDKANFNNLGKSMVALLGLVVALGVISKASRGVKFSSAVGLIAIIIGLKMLIGAIEDIADMDSSKIKRSLGSIVAILGMFALIMVASKFAGNNAAKAGVGILAISVALLLIIRAFKKLGKLDKSTLSKATDTISKILLVFAAITALSYFAGKNAVKAGSMMILMSGAVLVLTGVIYLLKDIEPEGLDKALKAISILGLVFAGLIVATKFASDCKGTLIVLTVAIAALTASIMLLSNIESDGLKNATTCLSVLMGVFAVLAAVSRFANGKVGSLAVLTGAVIAMTGVLILLSNIEPRALTAATTSLSIMIGMFALLIAATNLINTTNWTKSVAMMAGMTLVIAALAVVIGVLASLNVGSTIEIAASLSLLVVALAGACMILGGVGSKANDAIPIAYAMSGVVAILGAILWAMSELNVGPTLEIAESLSILLLSLSTACLVLSQIGPVASVASEGAAKLLALLGIVSAVILAVGAIVAAIPGSAEFIDEMIVVLEKLGYGIGSFVGNIVGGALAGLTSGLPVIGQNLSDFMTNAKPFIDGARTIDSSVLEGVAVLAGVVLMLTAADILSGLTSWLTGGSSFASFGEELAAFGPQLKAYADSVAGIDVEAVKASADAAKALAEMADTVPNEGGVISWFAGDNSVAKFGTEIASFGTNMKKFSNNVTGINVEAVKAAAEAGKSLAEMADTVPNEGGVISWFAGNNSVAKFGTEIANFGKSMYLFSNNVTGINVEAVKSATEAGKSLAEMANTVPNEGGVKSWFAGDNSVAKFGTEIANFGKSMYLFSVNVMGLKVDEVRAAADAGRTIADMTNIIPKDVNLSSFGSEVSKFGSSMKEFYNSIADIKASSMSATVDGFSEVVKKLEMIGKTGVDRFSSSFADSTAKSKVDSAVKNLIKSATSAIDGHESDFSLSATNLINAFIKSSTTSVESKKSEFQYTAKYLMDAFIAGLKDKQNLAVTACDKFAANAKDSIRKFYNDFKSVGSYLADGFSSGISENTYKATAKAKAMAEAALKAAKEALDEHSPSKEFYKVGSFAGEGFVNAFYDYKSRAYNAGSEIGNIATDGLSGAISTVKNLIDNGIDEQPVIRPVVDLSDISSGADRINGMFNMQPSVGALANINAIGSSMNANRNVSDNDVVSAIKDLGDKLGGSSGNTYNIEGVTYDDGSNIVDAVKTLVRAARVERRR